jgi:signal transduction histidine kinase
MARLRDPHDRPVPSDKGEIRVRCVARPERARPTVVLEISDIGPGISESVRETVFEPFVTTKRHGTGLGLALCRAIADVHRRHHPGGKPRPGAGRRLHRRVSC